MRQNPIVQALFGEMPNAKHVFILFLLMFEVISRNV